MVEENRVASSNKQSMLVLRAPNNEVAERIQLLTEDRDQSEQLRIRVNQKTRNGAVWIGQDVYKAKLMDLPCVVEAYTTNDKICFHKTNDVGQMLVVQEQLEDNENVDVFIDSAWPGPRQHPHGLTPGMQDVRSKVFRPRFIRSSEGKLMHLDSWREVKRLLLDDLQAEKVEWEQWEPPSELEESLNIVEQISPSKHQRGTPNKRYVYLRNRYMKLRNKQAMQKNKSLSPQHCEAGDQLDGDEEDVQDSQSQQQIENEGHNISDILGFISNSDSDNEDNTEGLPALQD